MATIPESHRDLLTGDFATLATVGPDGGYVFADKVGAKYGADLRQHDGPGDSRVVVTVEPVRVHAVDMSG